MKREHETPSSDDGWLLDLADAAANPEPDAVREGASRGPTFDAQLLGALAQAHSEARERRAQQALLGAPAEPPLRPGDRWGHLEVVALRSTLPGDPVVHSFLARDPRSRQRVVLWAARDARGQAAPHSGEGGEEGGEEHERAAGPDSAESHHPGSGPGGSTPSATSPGDLHHGTWLERASQLAQVHHASVPRVLGAAVHRGVSGFWTQPIEGRSLSRTLRAGPRPVRDAAQTALQLCDALRALHAVGMVHGNLGANTVYEDERGLLTLSDFPLAAASSAEEQTYTSPTGVPSPTAEHLFSQSSQGRRPHPQSPGLLSPPQSADIAAVGGLLLAMVAGAPSAAAATPTVSPGATRPTGSASVLSADFVDPTVPSAYLPDALRHVVTRALLCGTARGYGSLHELQADLRDLVEQCAARDGKDLGTQRRTGGGSASSPKSFAARPLRQRAAMLAGLAAPLLLALAISFCWRSAGDGRDRREVQDLLPLDVAVDASLQPSAAPLVHATRAFLERSLPVAWWQSQSLAMPGAAQTGGAASVQSAAALRWSSPGEGRVELELVLGRHTWRRSISSGTAEQSHASEQLQALQLLRSRLAARLGTAAPAAARWSEAAASSYLGSLAALAQGHPEQALALLQASEALAASEVPAEWSALHSELLAEQRPRELVSASPAHQPLSGAAASSGARSEPAADDSAAEPPSIWYLVAAGDQEAAIARLEAVQQPLLPTRQQWLLLELYRRSGQQQLALARLRHLAPSALAPVPATTRRAGAAAGPSAADAEPPAPRGAPTPEALELLARLELEAGSPTAVRRLEEALRTWGAASGGASAWAQRGALLAARADFLLGDFAAATRTALEVEQSPASPALARRATQLLMALHAEAGRNEGALTAWEAASESVRAHAAVQGAGASLLLRAGDRAGALAAARLAAQQAQLPEHEVHLVRLLCEMGDSASANQLAERLSAPAGPGTMALLPRFEAALRAARAELAACAGDEARARQLILEAQDLGAWHRTPAAVARLETEPLQRTAALTRLLEGTPQLVTHRPEWLLEPGLLRQAWRQLQDTGNDLERRLSPERLTFLRALAED